jgi:transglutaminase-like putative cysteine protease
MLIRAGFEISMQVAPDTPLVLALSPHPDALQPILGSGDVHATPHHDVATHRDVFGNHLSRITAQGGLMTLVSDFIVSHDGSPDRIVPEARQHPVGELHGAVLPFLTPSRFCESDLLADEAWSRFGHIEGGWARVQAVCDFVHGHIRFGYGYGRSTKTALEAFREGNGVCRDYAHLAVAMCRALNIPARYASGYLGDIGIAPLPDPMDFCAWFEVYLGGEWHTFDARYNTPRIGRILMVRGRDAADTAMITSFGMHALQSFNVWTVELDPNLTTRELRAMLRVQGEGAGLKTATR